MERHVGQRERSRGVDHIAQRRGALGVESLARVCAIIAMLADSSMSVAVIILFISLIVLIVMQK